MADVGEGTAAEEKAPAQLLARHRVFGYVFKQFFFVEGGSEAKYDFPDKEDGGVELFTDFFGHGWGGAIVFFWLKSVNNLFPK